jgi:type IV pilus assembly protein PilB
MHSPCGLMIFSGPTGCGKVTIMAGVVKQVMHPEINVMTVEDPVTFVLPGATQVMVNRKVGLTEAQAIRGFLRSDPDIIMVGDTPNLETAELAIQAAMTGHLVLAPLHANDAPLAVKRLFDMGVEPFLLSESLLMVQSQRLARKICENCRQKADYPEKFLSDLRKRAEAGGLVWPEKAPVFYRGKGCDHCRQTGYSGRIGIFEILTMEKKEMRELIAERASVEEIRKMAIADGMTTMLADGIYKALEGKTTIEEVVRVTVGQIAG